ncbi:sugar ABC transporter permease [Rhizobium vallis]|uniref:Sugar ABC transporter permease n=2 Tax=Rhizobium vallis TaxID=634290 RepID=A0A3S0S6R3_9HYPH|nr:sugar ABC transporter permease [Rhizobium vallis]
MATTLPADNSAEIGSVEQLKAAGRNRRRMALLPSVIGTLPMAATAILIYIVCIIFTVIWSFTDSRLFPNFHFIGFKQYFDLWREPRWIVSVANIWIFGFGAIVCNMVFGFLLAVFLDQRVKNEDLLRTIFLYPFALSLVITGLVWQWMMDPNLGIQSAVRAMGWTDFRFAPISNPGTALIGLVVGNFWNGVGVTMAILLAGLRGVDGEIWKAAKIDGIPAWRSYIFIVLPMMKGAIVTALVLQAVSIIRVFDLVVAMTGGGPGISTYMPALYVIQQINARNVAQGMAAATLMLLPVLAVLLLVQGLRIRAEMKAKHAK